MTDRSLPRLPHVHPDEVDAAHDKGAFVPRGTARVVSTTPKPQPVGRFGGMIEFKPARLDVTNPMANDSQQFVGDLLARIESESEGLRTTAERFVQAGSVIVVGLMTQVGREVSEVEAARIVRSLERISEALETKGQP